MSNNVVRMEPDEVENVAKTVSAEGEKADQVVKKMQSLIDMLKVHWDGEAALKFDEQFQQLRPSFDKMVILIGDISVQLDKSAKAYREFDLELSKNYGTQ